jgi:ketosteroid isomerase-like protein
MKLRQVPAAADLGAVKEWFQALADHVQAVDYEGARRLFAEDMIAFGTFTDFMLGRALAEDRQWRNVWSTIRRFRWRLGETQAIVSADRLTGIGMAVFDSDGYTPAGERFDRRGRATVSFARQKIGEPWVATHTHMSLFRGTPDQSHGSFSTPG